MLSRLRGACNFMKTIEERIAELKEIAESNCDRPKPFEAGIDVGRRGLAQDAMAIIQELQDKLEEREAYIVANPCQQCGGKINAAKAEAWKARADELQAESQMRFNMHQADAEGAKVIIAELEAQLEASKKSKGNYFLKTKIESLEKENEGLREKLEATISALKYINACDSGMQSAQKAQQILKQIKRF